MKRPIELLLLLLTFSGSWADTPSSAQQALPAKEFDEVVYEWLRTFSNVLHLAKERHYKISDPQQAMINAIEAFAASLDPHSGFLDQKRYKQMMESTSGEFFGIGIIIDNTRTQKDKIMLIIDTIPDGPADAAGIKPLDKIIEVDGEAIEGKTTEEIMSKIKGERNTKVHLKVLRDTQPDPISFDITRDVVKEQNSLCFQLDQQNVFYIALTMFSEPAMKQIAQLLERSRDKKYRALIIDLRNNSGGLLTSVVDIAGLFLEKESLVVTTKNKEGKISSEYKTHGTPIATDMPIFILINNYTASAAEILAGCLKWHSQHGSTKKQGKKLMVFLVGSRTFGKGSVQDVIPVGNNCALKLTESLYFLPGDLSIQAEGIVPDFEVDKTFPPTEQMIWFKKFYGSEKAFSNYIPNGSSKSASTTPDSKQEKLSWAERAKKNLEQDNQLREALTLINIYHLGKQCHPHSLNTRQEAIDFINSVAILNKPLGLNEVKINN